MVGVLADVNFEIDVLATDIAAHVQDAFAVFVFFIEEQSFFLPSLVMESFSSISSFSASYSMTVRSTSLSLSYTE